MVVHEQGLFYVAYLLLNPPEHPIHAIDLVAKIPQLYRLQLGLTQTIDLDTGIAVPLEASSRLQERNLVCDNAKSIRAFLKREKELEATYEPPPNITWVA